VVSFIPPGPWHDALTSVQELVAKSELGKHFAVLPGESLHCTIFGLVAENRKWRPNGLETLSPDEVEREVIKRMKYTAVLWPVWHQ